MDPSGWRFEVTGISTGQKFTLGQPLPFIPAVKVSVGGKSYLYIYNDNPSLPPISPFRSAIPADDPGLIPDLTEFSSELIQDGFKLRIKAYYPSPLGQGLLDYISEDFSLSSFISGPKPTVNGFSDADVVYSKASRTSYGNWSTTYEGGSLTYIFSEVSGPQTIDTRSFSYPTSLLSDDSFELTNGPDPDSIIDNLIQQTLSGNLGEQWFDSNSTGEPNLTLGMYLELFTDMVNPINLWAWDLPVLDITASKDIAEERDDQFLEFTVSRTGDTDFQLTAALALNGEAEPFQDYRIEGVVYSTNGLDNFIPATFKPGQKTTVVRLYPKADLELEPNETVSLSFIPKPFYRIGDNNVAIGTIQDTIQDGGKPLISIKSTHFVIPMTNEAGADKIARFSVYLSSRPEEEVSFRYSTIFGTASAADIQDISGTITIKPERFVAADEPVCFIDVPIKVERPVSDGDLEIFARDIAYKDWTRSGRDVDLGLPYGDRGYYVDEFIDGSKGFEAVGLTSDEKFFLLMTGVVGAQLGPNAKPGERLLPDELVGLSLSGAMSSEAIGEAEDKVRSVLGNSSFESAYVVGTIYDENKPPVLAFRGTEFSGDFFKDVIIADIVSPYIGESQITSNIGSIQQWLSKVQKPESDVTTKPILTGHSLGGALAQAAYRDLASTIQISQLITFESPGIDVNFLPIGSRVIHYVTSGDIVPLAGTGYVSGDVRILDEIGATVAFSMHSTPITEPWIDGYVKPVGDPEPVPIESYISPAFVYMDPDYKNFLLAFRAALVTEATSRTPRFRYVDDQSGAGVPLAIPISDDEWAADVETRKNSLKPIMDVFENRGNIEAARQSYFATFLNVTSDLFVIITAFGAVYGEKDAKNSIAGFLPSSLGDDKNSLNPSILTQLFPDREIEYADITSLLNDGTTPIDPSTIRLTPEEIQQYLSVLDRLYALPADVKDIFLHLPVAAFVSSLSWSEQFWTSLSSTPVEKLQAISRWSDATWEASTGWTDIKEGLDTLLTAPLLVLAADTGLNPVDGITANGTVLLEDLEPGASWQYSTDGGSAWNNGTGTSIRLTGSGPKTIIARQQDQVGNISSSSAALAFTLDDSAGLRLSAGFAQLIYVAYYGRPADPGGVAFWNGVLGSNDVSYAPRLGDRLTGAEVNAYDRIVNDFGNSTEAINLLAGLSNQQKVDQVYQFCFNRNAELDPITGVNYWVDQLDRGNISLAQLSVEVALGAQGIDIVVFSNKIRSADSFTGAIDTPAELNAFAGESARLFGISYLDGFGETAAGPSLGNAALDQFLSGSGVFTTDFPI